MFFLSFLFLHALLWICVDVNCAHQDGLGGNGNNGFLPHIEGLDIYNSLHDLDSWTMIDEGRTDFSGPQNIDYPLNMLPQDNSTYIELDDLLPPLDCSNGVTGSHFSSLCQPSASYSHDNMQQLHCGTRFAGMDGQHNLFANELAVLPNTSEGDIPLDALQMVRAL